MFSIISILTIITLLTFFINDLSSNLFHNPIISTQVLKTDQGFEYKIPFFIFTIIESQENTTGYPIKGSLKFSGNEPIIPEATLITITNFDETPRIIEKLDTQMTQFNLSMNHSNMINCNDQNSDCVKGIAISSEFRNRTLKGNRGENLFRYLVFDFKLNVTFNNYTKNELWEYIKYKKYRIDMYINDNSYSNQFYEVRSVQNKYYLLSSHKNLIFENKIRKTTVYRFFKKNYSNQGIILFNDHRNEDPLVLIWKVLTGVFGYYDWFRGSYENFIERSKWIGNRQETYSYIHSERSYETDSIIDGALSIIFILDPYKDYKSYTYPSISILGLI
jgi:hypothetical protein